MGGIWSTRQVLRYWLYVLVTVVFWSVALLLAGGEIASGNSIVRVSWQGAVLNLALLIPLGLGAEWARRILLFTGLVAAIFIGSLGFPPFGPALGLLALGAVTQILLLCSLQMGGLLGRDVRDVERTA